MEEEDWDTISVEEMENLIDAVNKFYEERGNPKVNIIYLADLFLKRLKNDLDYYVNCEGQKGYGKSNLMLLLSLMQVRYAGIYKRISDGKLFKVLPRTKPMDKDKFERLTVGFRFSKNMSFLDDVKDVEAKYHALDKYQSFVIDEGSKNLHKQKWMDSVSFKLVQLSDTERWQNKTFFICFPNFVELNSSFRNNRIMMRLYVYHRDVNKHFASCIISLKDINRHVPNPWHTEENAVMFEELLKRKPGALRTHHDILYAEQRLKGYAGNFDIPELKTIAPHIWDIYMRYKIMNAKKETNEPGEEESESERILRWKKVSLKLANWIKEKEPSLSYASIAEMMGIAPITFAQLRALKPLQPKEEKAAEKIINQDTWRKSY